MELGQLFWQSLLAAALRPAKQINRTGQFGLSKQCRASTRPPKIGKFTSTTLPSFNGLIFHIGTARHGRQNRAALRQLVARNRG
jgi:hypothetical protein